MTDVVKYFVASALNTGVAYHSLQLQIQMELVTGWVQCKLSLTYQ